MILADLGNTMEIVNGIALVMGLMVKGLGTNTVIRMIGASFLALQRQHILKYHSVRVAACGVMSAAIVRASPHPGLRVAPSAMRSPLKAKMA